MSEKNVINSKSTSNRKKIADGKAIDRRIDEMAAIMIGRYKGRDPLFVCLLRGGAPFASKLMFSIARQDEGFHPEIDYMTVSTYGQELVGGQPRIVMDLAPTTVTKGRPVIIVDDVLDKGHTASFTKAHLELRKASSVDLVVLVQKYTDRTEFGDASLFGFEVPDGWLVGMGMDDPRIAQDALRWAAYLAITSKQALDE
jgi:hypoxanthine phosphoribosyltransferase